MFRKHDDKGYGAPLPGVEMKTLVHGGKTLMAEFLLKKGSAVPSHSHPHEQTGYLVKGRLQFTIGSDEFDAAPGDSWCIAGGVEHGVEVVEDAVVLEVFSPVREDYLPKEKDN